VNFYFRFSRRDFSFLFILRICQIETGIRTALKIHKKYEIFEKSMISDVTHNISAISHIDLRLFNFSVKHFSKSLLSIDVFFPFFNDSAFVPVRMYTVCSRRFLS